MAAGILAKIASLDALLRKATCDTATKKGIAQLAKELVPFIEIREDRAKLFSGTGASRRVTAAGRGPGMARLN